MLSRHFHTQTPRNLGLRSHLAAVKSRRQCLHPLGDVRCPRTKVPCRWQETAGYGRIMGQPERSWQRVRCSETSSPDSDGVEWIRMVQRWVEMCKDLPNFFKILKPHQLCRIPTCCSRTGSAALAKARAALAHGIYHVEYGHMPSKQELSQWLYLLLAKSL